MTEATDDSEFAESLYNAYVSGYEDPRPIHYGELAEEFNVEELAETDAVADAFDLGCLHSQNEVEKLSNQELLEEMASW